MKVNATSAPHCNGLVSMHRTIIMLLRQIVGLLQPRVAGSVYAEFMPLWLTCLHYVDRLRCATLWGLLENL